jgi:hypothetical protein
MGEGESHPDAAADHLRAGLATPQVLPWDGWKAALAF